MNNLYQPSLIEEDVTETKSFQIQNLFFPAAMGGLLAITFLGIKNAKWLKLDKKQIQLLASMSIILILIKYAIIYAIGQQVIAIDEQYVKIIGRGFGVICFFIFFLVLNKAFKGHELFVGKIESLWTPGITACLALGAIDALITSALLSL